MKFKFCTLSLIFVSSATIADEYQSFTDANYRLGDYGFAETNDFLISSQYYFGSLNNIGPRKEFSYILPVSNVYGSYFRNEREYEGGLANYNSTMESFSVGGEYFSQQLKIFGGVSDSNSRGYHAGIGYLFTSNFLAEVEVDKQEWDVEYESSVVEYDETTTWLRGRYNHQISDTDYIGFSAQVDDDFDSRSISSKYFTALSSGRYLTAGLNLNDRDGIDLYWGAEVEFFFNQDTSVGARYDEFDDFEVNATHFFNRNVAANFSYGSSTESSLYNLDIFSIGLTVQL
ncbi:putative porin [Microbulbifer sp. CAU 1566]|uniref:putative porin n=1 Tax=Microbulbifer sp. CAU 1566 TaxID=2933269 RepID=UPI002006AE11|nr:putative porin [Microbulbifer sp. CAU 1566]MCK7597987.1 putative porin [Microbulbifer sp. CAU 1566]